MRLGRARVSQGRCPFYSGNPCRLEPAQARLPNHLIKRKFIDDLGLTAVGEARKMRATLAT